MRKKERIEGTPEQRIESAKKIFGQARTLYEATESKRISEDPRLREALRLLDLPLSLPKAIEETGKKKAAARKKVEEAQHLR